VLTAPQGIDPLGLFLPFDLASRPRVIAAVSGGSDSTALLLLLKQHLDRFLPKTRLFAVTIDHALRPESADEAATVAKLCAGFGIAHRTLTWTGDKPATGLAAAAREARHKLLAEAAAAEKTDLVLTGHTANDQAETVLMRQARGDAHDAGRGIAGIAPATLFDGRVWFARPLLGIRRETLRAFLRQNQVGWIEDPSNVNQRYERPRVRKKLREADGEAAIATALKVAAEAARQRKLLGEAVAELIRDHADCPAPGLLRLQPGFFQAKHADAAIYALRTLLAVTGGTLHLPDQARAAALYTRLAAGEPVRAVLSRTLVDQRKAGVFLLREARGLPDSEMLQEGLVWDGRYRIVAPSPGVRSRRPKSSVRGKQVSDTGVPESLVRLAAAAQPALPPNWTAVPILAPWARYLPSFDLAPARAAAELIGAPQVPAPPFHEHNESKA
jgi:tRNA(Ile)-lysidine synthase